MMNAPQKITSWLVAPHWFVQLRE